MIGTNLLKIGIDVGVKQYSFLQKFRRAAARPVVLFHVLLPGLGRGRVEYLGSAQIFYSPSAQPRQKDMQENYRSDLKVFFLLLIKHIPKFQFQFSACEVHTSHKIIRRYTNMQDQYSTHPSKFNIENRDEFD